MKVKMIEGGAARMRAAWERAGIVWGRLRGRVREKLACQAGQGTTEYAILVGILVVIAILAITLFRPKLQELWDVIAAGINGL